MPTTPPPTRSASTARDWRPVAVVAVLVLAALIAAWLEEPTVAEGILDLEVGLEDELAAP